MHATPHTPSEGVARWIWPSLLEAFFLFMIGALIILGSKNEETFHVLMREDAWAEWCTFLAFLTASVLAFDGMVRRSGGGLERVAFAGLGLFCFFVAGEEISWGQRLLGFTPPEVFLKKTTSRSFKFTIFFVSSLKVNGREVKNSPMLSHLRTGWRP